MGYGDIEPYGARDVRTPNLTRLAASGVRLSDAYAASPVCTPSRASLLTGRYPERFGVEKIVGVDPEAKGLPRSEVTTAQDLKTVGYSTAMIGKWHLGFGEESGPNAHGFDESLAFYDWSIDYFSHREPTGKPGLFENGKAVELKGYTTDIFSDRASAFIANSSSRPFFLYLAYNAALPPSQPPDHPNDVRAASSQPVSGERWHAYTREDYVHTVEAMDRGIGHVLDMLDKKGIRENTLVVYAHDHGGRVGISNHFPLREHAGSLQEGAIRVPCILSWPRVLRRRDTISSLQAILMDIPATFAAAAGIAEHRQFDGIDLIPLLNGVRPLRERTFFWRYCTRPEDDSSILARAVRRGHWKYFEKTPTEIALYDLQHDIAEQHDLAKENPNVVTALARALDTWNSEMLPVSC